MNTYEHYRTIGHTPTEQLCTLMYTCMLLLIEKAHIGINTPSGKPKSLYRCSTLIDNEELDGRVEEMVVEVLEFKEQSEERIDLIDGTLYIGYYRLDGGKKIEGISSIQVWSEDNFPIGILRKNGILYHVVKLEVKGNYAKAVVKTRR